MAIYRPEQARLSFAPEPFAGAYVESNSSTATGGIGTKTLTSTPASGNSSLTLTAADPPLTQANVGDYIQFGSASDYDSEVRRIIYIDPDDTNKITLDYPLAFNHSTSVTIRSDFKKENASTAQNYNYATFLPGVYESIQVPDLTPELMPKYFLKDNNDRNWSYMYRGRQVFNGALGNTILLNGFPLRFALGKEKITSTSRPADNAFSDSKLARGTVVLPTAAGSFMPGDKILVFAKSNTEDVESRIIVKAPGTMNLPLNYDYDGYKVLKVTDAIYKREIIETGRLPALTWNILMNDSDSNDANKFIRRFVGGIVNRATLSADEGGLLMFSWDDVQFLDFVHNQTMSTHNDTTLNTSVHTNGKFDVERGSAALLDPHGIGGSMEQPPTGSTTLGKATYPENEPYYFSEGLVTFFGQPFARIRNFRLEINNNVDARYYINRDNGRRGPAEFQEQFREYTMSAALAMSDSQAANSATRTMWKELILEGNYEGFGQVGKMTGFDIKMDFVKGTHKITIESPGKIGTTPKTNPNQIKPRLDSQGCFFRRATHNIEQEAPVQAEGEIVLRDLKISIQDDEFVYP